MTVTCDYCGEPAELVDGRTIYPHRPDLAHKSFYRCWPCKAYVGCHPGTKKPLGRLATAALRKAKQNAHAAFDPIWKAPKSNGKRKQARNEAYAWLAKKLGVHPDKCHIGMFDESMCARTIAICEDCARRSAA